MAKKVSDEDALEIAKIIATQAVDELKIKNPLQLIKTSNVSIDFFNKSDSEQQDKIIEQAVLHCTEAYTQQFYSMIKENAIAFFTSHTQLFDQAEIDLEEYFVDEN